MLETIFIDGRTIGYQFNQKSLGSRTIHRRVHDTDGLSYIFYSGNKIRVVPIHHSSSVFEAVHIIPQ